MLILLFLFYSCCFSFLIFTLCAKKETRLYILSKSICSVAFTGIFVYSLLKSGQTQWFSYLLPAFLFCMIGDILLAVYKLSKKQGIFFSGAGFFLFGHLAFISYLCHLQPLFILDFIIPFCCVGLIFLFRHFSLISIGKPLPFILLYTFCLGLFFSKSLRMLLTIPTASSLYFALGSLLFFISDFILLFLHFSKRDSLWLHITNLTTYYYGMFFLAVSFCLP